MNARAPAATSLKRQIRRAQAWLYAAITGRGAQGAALTLVLLHVAIWTAMLAIQKSHQDLHSDVTEAFGWGQHFQLGYGKHPPLSGWVAGLWFMIFPVKNWAAYALAMTTSGAGLYLCWMLARRVTDDRRALFVLAMLAIYPVFTFKGYKYNADTIQLVTFPLLLLAYLRAFEQRSASSGVWLGLAAAVALLAKYWALTLIGAIGLTALLHPARLAFLRSPAPWVALAVAAAAMTPHVIYLAQSHFAPLLYAGETHAMPDYHAALQRLGGYFGHAAGLLALPLALAGLALLWPVSAWRGNGSAARWPHAATIWWVQAILAIGPALGAVAFKVRMKSDWAIPMFFLVPIALVALPRLSMHRRAPLRLVAIWLLVSLGALAASPWLVSQAGIETTYAGRSQLALELTTLWRTRFATRWEAVVAPTEISELMPFYSPDRPAAFVPGDRQPSGLVKPDSLKRTGFIGVCTNDVFSEICEAWMAANAPGAERLSITARRYFDGKPGPLGHYRVVIVPPGR